MARHQITNLPLSANPDTDIWRKPPAHDVFNVTPTYLDIPTFTPNKLERALITFTGEWTEQFDQAGIILHITTPNNPTTKPSWIKTGIEFFNNKPYISFVGCDRWADWSITPLQSEGKKNGEATSIELQVKDGTTLWAYEVSLDDKGEVVERFPIRECTWPLFEEGSKAVRIGAYACRPAKVERVLKAHVEKLEVVLRDA